MSDELSRKVIEAGVVPASAVRLLKMWRSLPDDLPDREQEEKTAKELMTLVREIGELLERDEEIPEMKETDFDLEDTWSRSARTVELIYRVGTHNRLIRHPSARTRQGGFFFPFLPDVEVVLRPGTQITTHEAEVFEITQVSPRYVDKGLRYLVCDVQKVPKRCLVGG